MLNEELTMTTAQLERMAQFAVSSRCVAYSENVKTFFRNKIAYELNNNDALWIASRMSHLYESHNQQSTGWEYEIYARLNA
jgi:uncharacterized protein YigE (DUF2233 family)